MAGKNNSNKEKTSKKKKIIIVASIVAGVLVVFGATLIVGYFGFGNGMKSGEEAETENTNSEAYGESTSREEEVCWIAETEKEKALAIQEYTSNALLEIASAETEETDIYSEAASRGDGGLAGDDTEDTEEASTEEDTSSSKSSSSSSNSSSSSGSSGSSSNKSSSSGSSGSSSNKSSSSGSTTKHTHSYTSTVTKQPTCSSTGTITYTCSCGDSYTEEIAATGHTWVEYTYTEEVDLGPVYEEKFVCSRCNAQFDTGAEASEHMETVHAGQICSFANCSVKTSDHHYVTNTYEGYKCSVCGATK